MKRPTLKTVKRNRPSIWLGAIGPYIWYPDRYEEFLPFGTTEWEVPSHQFPLEDFVTSTDICTYGQGQGKFYWYFGGYL